MRAAKHQNWIFAGFLLGSAFLAARSGGEGAAPCSRGLCEAPTSVAVLERLAAERFAMGTNEAPFICVEVGK